MRIQFISWCAAFSLGAILCAIVLSGLSRRPVAAPQPVSLTPAMDVLNNYSCRWAETKHVILGGREDGYSPDGEEIARPGSLYDYYVTRTGSPSIGATRGYDEDGFDNAFIDRFEGFPPRIAHGLFAVRFRQLGTLKTDYLSLGGLEAEGNSVSSHNTSLDPEVMKPNWAYANGVMSTQLESVGFRTRYDDNDVALPKPYDTLLDYLRESGARLDLVISDDTIVDMVGFAICTEPETRKGTTFLAERLTDEIVNVACTGLVDRSNHCNKLAGDTLCSAELPLTCFSEVQDPYPRTLTTANGPNMSWSGGEVAFTTPIRGDSLASQSEGHALCRKTFGEAYRMANIHEGVQSNGFSGFGRVPASAQVWVDSNLEPYGNCWPRTSDYPEKDQEG